jgi:hypothetical protein
MNYLFIFGARGSSLYTETSLGSSGPSLLNLFLLKSSPSATNATRRGNQRYVSKLRLIPVQGGTSPCTGGYVTMYRGVRHHVQGGTSPCTGGYVTMYRGVRHSQSELSTPRNAPRRGDAINLGI